MVCLCCENSSKSLTYIQWQMRDSVQDVHMQDLFSWLSSAHWVNTVTGEILTVMSGWMWPIENIRLSLMPGSSLAWLHYTMLRQFFSASGIQTQHVASLKCFRFADSTELHEAEVNSVCFIWRKRGEAGMISPACSEQDENTLDELRSPDCV